MVEVGNQYIILVPIFLFLLVIIPRMFIGWSSKIRPVDENGILMINYPMLYSFMTPHLKLMSCPLIIGCMRELDEHFPGK